MVLQTQRLTLRPYQPSDAAAIFDFMSDSKAMMHTYVAPSLDQCASRLYAYEATRSTHGFAPWVVSITELNEIVGWGGLSYDPEQPGWGLEVSYAFTPNVWGKGYATELVQNSLRIAFDAHGILEVHAFAKPENERSMRVLEKCGFQMQRYEPSLKRNHYLVTSVAEISK